ncbi:thioredoxin-dependent thiol peroxidase [Chitinophaga sp. Cy-1792]|uniref:thioredoxin-dependent thiol peroxidase n=1 Tax=Chitinophaga sp. Cy-1792 TaxID=2608339 RepID=UPI00141FFAB7|nr:thioredoxin-dependent thiol peroxidase [Chitinophaga sp. Cy-1792]NIG52014.1 thioredoxin-dependent thiol peroxidase [Chitinophaga sp. Cy-1792]
MAVVLKEGDKAPVFKGKDQHGKTISLTDYKGKKVILYFYPKDNTPGCTAQACNLRDNYTELLKKGYVVVGVSTDSEQSHQKFIEKFELPFTLLADDDHKVVNQYGVWGEKKMMGKTYDGTHRTTFLINGDGVIEHIIKKPDTKNHTEEILELWK